MTLHYAPAQGHLIAPAGHLWAAYSAVSGETSLLNDEGAAMLEVLAEGPSDTGHMCAVLAADMGTPASALTEQVQSSWARLVAAGLVVELGADLAALK